MTTPGHHPEEGKVAFLPCCSTKCDNMPSQPHTVRGKTSQAVSPSSPVGGYPPRKKAPKSTHARRRPGEDAQSDKHELCDRTLLARVEGLEVTLTPRPLIPSTARPFHSDPQRTPLRDPQRTLRNPPLRAHGASLSGGRSKLRTPP